MIHVEIKPPASMHNVKIGGVRPEAACYDIASTTFSGGELHVSFPPLDSLKYTNEQLDVRLLTRIQDVRGVMELLLAVELLRRELHKQSRFELVLPYMPYARQDRATDNMTSFSLKVFAQLLNSCKFDKVVTFDPHSDVTAALVDNISIIEQHTIIRTLYKGLDEFIHTTKPVIVAPDAGAAKKAWKVAKNHGLPLITAEKVRNVSNGEIVGTSFHNTSVNFAKNVTPNFLIVDDICDGGRTFTQLARAIRSQHAGCHITLYVTHGIFSQGFTVFKDLIDRIYCTDTFIPEQFPLDSAEPPLFVGKVTPHQLWRKV